jgi:spore germination protein
MPTPEGINYVVKPGDTLFKIAQRFGISWVEIAEANGLVNPNEIYAGQMIKIPVDAPTPPPVVYHVVQPGETLFRISLRYGLPWLAIANVNHIGPPYIIYSGQTLIIPGGH